jgi:hypothetical protein
VYPSGDAVFSSYAIYTGIKRESLLISGMIPAEGSTIELKEGQYIKLIYATMTPAYTT